MYLDDGNDMMLFFMLVTSIVKAGVFETKDVQDLNVQQQDFVDKVLNNEVFVSRRLYRYNTFVKQRHWTYSDTKLYSEGFALLQEAKTYTVYSGGDFQKYYKVYTPDNLVVFPKLNQIEVEQWHQLLVHASESLLVGDISQSTLEDCAVHDKRPKRLYISGVKRYTTELRKCFPNTEISFLGITFIDPSFEEAFQSNNQIPDSLSIVRDMDSKSAGILQGYKGEVTILGERLPRWFDSVYSESAWESVSFPDVTVLTTNMANSMLSKEDGHVRFPNVTSISEKVSKKFIGTEEHHLQGLSLPKLFQISPKSLGHLTTHIPLVEVGPLPWTGKEVKAIQGEEGDLIIHGASFLNLHAGHQLYERQRKKTRGFHFRDVQINDPKILEMISSLQYFTDLRRNNTSKPSTIVDFQFEDWNMGLVSTLDPVERGEGHRYAEEYAGKQVKQMTSANGYSYGGNKPFEVMKTLAEDESRWYVLHCFFQSDCINFTTETITKEYSQYIVENYSNAELAGRFTNEALEDLTKLKGKLKLSLGVLSVEQAKILAKGSFSELNLRVPEVTEEALLALSDYKGKLSLPEWMHHKRELQPYMLLTEQIDFPNKWELQSLKYVYRMTHKNLRINLTQKPSFEQLQSVAQYKGVLSFSLVFPEDPKQTFVLTQDILDVLSTSQAKSLYLALQPSTSQQLDWNVFSEFTGPLSIHFVGTTPKLKESTIASRSLLMLVENYSGSNITLGPLNVLTNEFAKVMVNQSCAIRITAIDVEPDAVKTLLEANHKENMSVETSATSKFCWTHIKNNVCYSDIWDCNEGCDTGGSP
jgi:hypothetical protein